MRRRRLNITIEAAWAGELNPVEKVWSTIR
jgi:hypothetical protein